MGRSNRLHLDDIRAVFRLVGEVAELRLKPEMQQMHLANGVCDLLRAIQGYTVRFEGFDEESDVRITQMYPGGTPNPAVLRAWNHWESQDKHTLRDDPMVDYSAKMSAAGYNQGTYLRSEVIEDTVWYHSPVFEFLLDHVKVEHLAVSWFNLDHKTAAMGIAVQRLRGERPFSKREHKLFQFLSGELIHLHQQGKLTGAGLIEDTLSPRQTQFLRMLLLGKSPKRIAYELGLTVATVRTYIRDLYKRVGVSGREELMARYVSEGGIDGPSDAELRT